MDIRCAPMEGLTDPTFRRLHHQCFGGVDKYYIPFVSPTQHHVFTPHDLREIAPEVNEGVPVVPQVLWKDAGHFLWAAGEMKRMGYEEVNLNLGCPSGTVTAKGKGAGALRDLMQLRTLLEEIFAHTPVRVSIKTRIGFSDPGEWPEILGVLSHYPMTELIVHLRTRQEFYQGDVHREAFALAREKGLPLVYNGNLFTAGDCRAIQGEFPGVPMMMGRGLLTDPALPRVLRGGEEIAVEEIRRFLLLVREEYACLYTPAQAFSKTRELMKYIACCFTDVKKPLKALRKAAPDSCDQAIERILACKRKEEPGYCYETWMGL